MKNSKKIILSTFILFLFASSFCSCTSDNSQTQTTAKPTVQETRNESTQPTTVPQTTQSSEVINSQKLDDIVKKMTIEEKVGQMFYVRCPDTAAVETVSKYHLGGYILFGRDFDGKTKKQITDEINSYQSAALIPLLIGVDEEGGTVVRVSSNPNLRDTPFLSPSDTYASDGWYAIEQDAAEKADLLLSLGINVNMAPNCDITSDPDAFMYYRSFSSNVEYECKFVKTVVEISKEKQLGTVLKHFPGYGNNEDTHTGIAYDTREYSEFETADFRPFKTGIDSGADCILVSHNIVDCMDSKYPASLSSNVHNIIRNELGFNGVIMTDDLAMSAITEYTGTDSAAVFAAKCGNDILCCSDVDVQYPAVLQAVQNGEISERQIDQSVKRILKWKQDIGLID